MSFYRISVDINCLVLFQAKLQNISSKSSKTVAEAASDASYSGNDANRNISEMLFRQSLGFREMPVYNISERLGEIPSSLNEHAHSYHMTRSFSENHNNMFEQLADVTENSNHGLCESSADESSILSEVFKEIPQLKQQCHRERLRSFNEHTSERLYKVISYEHNKTGSDLREPTLNSSVRKPQILCDQNDNALISAYQLSNLNVHSNITVQLNRASNASNQLRSSHTDLLFSEICDV